MPRLAASTTSFSRKLRREMTEAEKHLWRFLRIRQMNGAKFRRQHPVGRYILDFACVELKVAVEVDGGQHMENAQYDRHRNDWLKTQGWEILRFWNTEVLQNTEGVLQVIEAALAPSPS